jgi:hypothetical protein
LSTVTDPAHLNRLLTELATTAAQLARHWADEHAAAYAQTAGDGGRSAPGPSDPTCSVALLPRKHQHADRIGAAILRAHRTLGDALADVTPRTPTRDCRCCQREKATHGRDHNYESTDCWACWLYQKRMGYRCGDDIHDDRPRIRMCECSDTCCDVCPDRAADGRTVSERCRKRMYRASKYA